MEKRSTRWGCLLGVILILVILLLGGGWWLYRSQTSVPAGEPPSLVLVTITSPSSGDEVNAGDFVSVSASAIAPDAIQSMELFLDGQSLGKLTDPSNASWTWQAWPLGIHSFYAQATDDKGHVGYSQVVIINVLAGNGVMQIPAAEGETLDVIAGKFGLPPGAANGSNPFINPLQPLPEGQPVKIPVGKGGSGNGSGQGAAPGSPFFFIEWNIKFTQPVNQSYCYTSTGDGKWEKMPKDPFTFFDGVDVIYTQVISAAENVVVQVDCWGWLAGVLKYLGQGQAQFSAIQPPGEVTISGEGFIINGIPKFPPIKEEQFLAGGLEVPPPFALRKSTDEADCTAHGHPILAPFICKDLMKKPGYLVLEWEWTPKFCAPWDINCKWYDTIDGYRLYEIDPATKKKTFISEIKPQASKIAAVQVPWVQKCYGVEAFTTSSIPISSEMVTYCPGQLYKMEHVVLTPTHWLTTGGEWIQNGDCDEYGGLDYYESVNQKGFGNQVGQVLVGSYLVDDDDCYREGYYWGGVQFDLKAGLPFEIAIQKAELSFSKAFMDYGATGWAGGKPISCIKSIGNAKSDWSGLSAGNHFASKSPFSSSFYVSVSPFVGQVDVTTFVKGWLKNPAGNHGLVLLAASAPHPSGDGSGECLSGLGNVQLNIYYLAP